jgi:hypothetical protein
MSLSLVTLCLALVADEPISPEKSAKIEQAEQKARAEVTAKYGNRKPTDMSAEERKSLDKDLADASKQVLEKNGVEPKAWARESLKRDRSDYAKTKELVKELNEKDKAQAEAAKKAASEPKEIEIQRGSSDSNPVVLDEKPNEDGTVQVEQGLPPDAARDFAEANGDESGGMPSGPPMPNMDEAPAPKTGKGGKGGKHR